MFQEYNLSAGMKMEAVVPFSLSAELSYQPFRYMVQRLDGR